MPNWLQSLGWATTQRCYFYPGDIVASIAAGIWCPIMIIPSDQSADSAPRTFTAFCGYRLVASGALESTVRQAKGEVDRGEAVLLIDDLTGEQIDLDLSGSPDDAVARLSEHSNFEH